MILSNDKTTGALRISGTLDIDAAGQLRDALLDCLLHEAEVTADLSEADACDAAALQILLAAQRDAATAGKPFRLIGISTAVAEAAAGLGLALEAHPHAD